MALLTKDPGDGVHDIRLTASVWADDARDAAAAERNRCLLAERLEAKKLDFAEFQHPVPRTIRFFLGRKVKR